MMTYFQTHIKIAFLLTTFLYSLLWNLRGSGRNNFHIDFNEEVVIAIFRGTCPSLSYGVSVEKILSTEDSVFVYIKHLNHGEKCKKKVQKLPILILLSR